MRKYTGVFIVLLIASLDVAAAKARKIDFVKEIQPIFEYNCVAVIARSLPKAAVDARWISKS